VAVCASWCPPKTPIPPDLKAIDAGYSVCYERMVNLVDILDNAPYQKISKYRLAKLKKSQVIIIDEIGVIRHFF